MFNVLEPVIVTKDEAAQGNLRGWPGSYTFRHHQRKTHSVTVKGVEDSGDVTAEDADRNPSVVQRQPAATRLL